MVDGLPGDPASGPAAVGAVTAPIMAPEPPYGIICPLLREGGIVPFLGAGASLSTVPATPTSRPPTGAELALQLALEAAFPLTDLRDRQDLVKVASFYQDAALDREGLRSRLRREFCANYTSGAVHQLLAEIAQGLEAAGKGLLVVTTNYDHLVEQAFDERGVRYHLVVHLTDRTDKPGFVQWWMPGSDSPNEDHTPGNLPLSLERGSIIYKMHGNVHPKNDRWDSFVISEDDYVDFLSRMGGAVQSAIPALLMEEFRARRFLFLGYGLNDWNFRVMLKNLFGGANAGREPKRSWAIQYKPNELEKRLWTKKNVNIYDLEIDAFVASARHELGLP